MDILIGLLAIIISIIMYFWGRYEGKKEKKEDHTNSLIDKMVERYNDWNSRNYDNGFHALAKLGLPLLENDKNIREAIRRIKITCGERPLKSFDEDFKNCDLFDLFSFIANANIDVFHISPTELIALMKQSNEKS